MPNNRTVANDLAARTGLPLSLIRQSFNAAADEPSLTANEDLEPFLMGLLRSNLIIPEPGATIHIRELGHSFKAFLAASGKPICGEGEKELSRLLCGGGHPVKFHKSRIHGVRLARSL